MAKFASTKLAMDEIVHGRDGRFTSGDGGPNSAMNARMNSKLAVNAPDRKASEGGDLAKADHHTKMKNHHAAMRDEHMAAFQKGGPDKSAHFQASNAHDHAQGAHMMLAQSHVAHPLHSTLTPGQRSGQEKKAIKLSQGADNATSALMSKR